MGNSISDSTPTTTSCEVKHRNQDATFSPRRVIGYNISVFSLNVGCLSDVDHLNGFANKKFSGWQIKNRIHALKDLLDRKTYTIVALSGICVNAVIHIKGMLYDLGYESIDEQYAIGVNQSHWYIIGYRLFPNLSLFHTYQYTFTDIPVTAITTEMRKTDSILLSVNEKLEQSSQIVIFDWHGEKIVLATVDFNSNFDYQKKCTQMLLDHLKDLEETYQVDGVLPRIIVSGNLLSYRIFDRIILSMFEDAKFVNSLHQTGRMPTYVSYLFDSLPDKEINALCLATSEMSDSETRKAFLARCLELYGGPTIEQFDHIFVKNIDQAKSSIILPKELENVTESDFKEKMMPIYEKSVETGIPFMVSDHLPCKITFVVK